jgi:hypothetical protein
MKITLDIETIGTSNPAVREYIAKGVTHPATMSKPETIAKWEAETKESAIDEAVAKTSFDGAFGQVVCVGIKFDDEPAECLHGLDEAALLHALNAHLEKVPMNEHFDTCIIGHNVVNFDLRFLMQRYMVLGIRPHMAIHRAAAAKPWESEKVFDTMVQFAGNGNRVSLDKLCFAFGVPTPKGDLDGSKVGEYVKAGRIAEVAEYCTKDVEATHDVFKRMTWAELRG